MTTSVRGLGKSLIIVAVIALTSLPADAGRVGGPTAFSGVAPAGMSVFYEVSFSTGPAVLNLVGSGTSQLYLIVYDTDGHIIVGNGVPNTIDSRVLQMNVYRAGTFRVEVRNMGIYDNAYRLTTN